MFARNCWYVAAWCSELTSKPLARTLLGEPVILFRTASGRVAALEDRCCHRGMPLAAGEVDGEIIRCGYHGLEFAPDGACMKVPGQDRIPPSCQVRSYPVVERDALLWIWMGVPERADPSTIIPYPWHGDPQWGWQGTTMPIQCHHELINDNLLDLTHVGVVHKQTIGGDAKTHATAKMKTTRDGAHVRVVRWMLDVVPPPAFVSSVGFQGRIDRWQEIDFWPGVIHIWAGATDAGTGAYEGKREGGFQSRIFNGITPETETSSFYFWSAAHNFRVGEPGVTEKHFKTLSYTFDEDKLLLEMQQKRRAQNLQRELVDVNGDIAGLQARRIIQRLLDQERGPATTAAE